jgi:hypothetical protein
MIKRWYHTTLFSITIFVALMLLHSPVAAQAQQPKPPTPPAQEQPARPPAEEKDWVSRVFEIKYADVGRLAEVFRAFGLAIVANRDLKILAVRGPREIMATIEEAIKRLDVPPPPVKNIEVTVYLLMASEQAGSSTNIPSELQAVINQLKGVFAYQGFHLLDTLVMRSRDGERGELSGTVPGSSAEVPIFYTLSFLARAASDDKERVIRIDKLNLGVRMPITIKRAGQEKPEYEYQNTGLNTSIDVREGQKVIVGKPTTSLSSADESKNALIVVVTAKVVS